MLKTPTRAHNMGRTSVLQTGPGWEGFTAGFLMGGEAGVAWAYVCTQILPYYQ